MDIKEIHSIYLDMLKAIDSICRKYDIKYHIEAGTLLGAIRHKGFIPWDDDCDLTFYRDDYEKFKRVAIKDLEDYGMKFVEAKENDTFHDFINRIFYTKKVYREDDIYKNELGGLYQYLWIDLFILDDVDISKKDYYFTLQKIVYGFALGHRKDLRDKFGNKFQFLIAKILALIGKTISLSKIYDMQEKLSLKCRNKGYDYVYCSNYPPIWMWYSNEKAKELDIIYTDFEDTKLPVIRTYDEYLTVGYGDYMRPPDIKDQVPSHARDIF